MSTGDMIDAYKQVDGKGRLIDVVEQLNDTSQNCMDDWSWMECNSGTKHTRAIRTGLPSVSWGILYGGIPQSKSTKQTVSDTTGFVEGLSSVDERQLDLYSDKKVELRAAEARSHIESMSQELMTALFYHNSDTNARYPKGLAARFSTLDGSGAGNQIIDAGGSSTDNTSIWFVDWSYDGLSVIYPEGTTAGIDRQNKGKQRVTDSNGDPYYVEEELIRAHCGFSLGDYRRIVRIANIDVSDLAAGSVDLYKYMRQAYWRLHNRRVSKVQDQKSPGRIAIYANRDVCEALDALGTNDGSSDSFIRLRPSEIQGKEVMTYRGFPLRETDAILNTEAEVTT
jgi:hypothetical protein